jgi:serine/threonine protein kinase
MATATTDPLLGALVGERYEVVGRVAAGARGVVYRAEQLPLRRPVALRLPGQGPGPGPDDPRAARFLRDAAALVRLRHPSTVRTLDYGFHDGRPFLVMELVDGVPVTAAGGPMPPVRALAIAAQVATSLAEAHERGLVHGAVDPVRVLLSEDRGGGDRVRVCDYGLASPSLTALVDRRMSLPDAVAPEQIRGGLVGPAADVYGLGVVLYTALAGRRPFADLSGPSRLVAHLSRPVPPLTGAASPALRAVLDALLAKHEGGRPADGQAARRLLGQAARALLDGDTASGPASAWLPLDDAAVDDALARIMEAAS